MGTDDPTPFGYFHAGAQKAFGSCYGCDGVLNVWTPYTEHSNDHSIMQTWVQNYDYETQQSVEAGWTVDQDLKGDSGPHLFTYYTTNSYSKDGDNLGRYNQDVDGWVQVDAVIFPGALLTPASIEGGSQTVVSIKYQLYQNNWWFQVQGIWIGYYPGSLFEGNRSVFGTLANLAEWIAFGGEVQSNRSNPTSTTTQMGSGLVHRRNWPGPSKLKATFPASFTQGCWIVWTLFA
jgi:hypothetical protein